MQHAKFYIKANGPCKRQRIVFRLFLQNHTSKHALYSKYFENVPLKVGNPVQRSTSLDIFWNENQEEEKLSFVAIVQVYTKKQLQI